MDRRTFIAATGAGGLTAAAATLPAMAGPVVVSGGPAAADSDRPGLVVRSLDELRAAIAAATPGTVVTVADGTYDAAEPIAITGKRGTCDEPIVVRAESVGGVVLNGAQTFILSASSDVTISGFAFRGQTSTFDVPPDCKRIRLTRNDFQLADVEGLHWVMIRGDHTEFDHNEFHDKSKLGIFMGVEGAGTDQMAVGVHIHHNYFRDHTFPGDNGGEPIRLGLSPRALATAGAVVERNLFERCNGDPEAISVKSSGNTVRHNTMRDSMGGIVLRHGNGTRVDGNQLLSGRNGIRIYGNDHLIVNNYLEKISNAGVVLGSGSVRDHYPGEPPKSRTGNDAPDRVRIALNTVLDCESGIVGESHRTLPPLDCSVTDNLLVADTGELVNMPFQDGITWSGNIHWGQGTDGNAPAAGFTRVDPQLAAGTDGVRRLTSDSPAINAASRAYPDVRTDLDGDQRTGRAADVGADEYSPRRTTYPPLTPADVGPHAR